MQVGASGAEAPASVNRAVEGGKPLLAKTVHVAGEFVATFLDGAEKGPEERTGRRTAFEHQGTVRPAVLVAAREAVLHPLEVRQAVRVVPLSHAGIAGPAFKVHGVTALEDHAVDAARTAQQLAPGVVDLAPAHVRFRFGLVRALPVSALE